MTKQKYLTNTNHLNYNAQHNTISVDEGTFSIDNLNREQLNTIIHSMNTKAVCWKGLSHAVRVLQEVEELLDAGFITFPLLGKEWVKEIKEEKILLKTVMDYLDVSLDRVNEKLEISNLPKKSDEAYMDSLILDWVK